MASNNMSWMPGLAPEPPPPVGKRERASERASKPTQASQRNARRAALDRRTGLYARTDAGSPVRCTQLLW